MLQACQYGSVDKATTVVDSDSNVLHIALLPTEECRPFYIAQECGLYDSLQITVKIDQFMAAMDADTAFMNGEAQLLVTDSLKQRYLNQLLSNDTLVAIISDNLRLSLLTNQATRINSINSLKERIVAVTRHSAIDYFADQTMDKAKIKREYLNRPQINNIELRANMLNLNQYDGAILPEPYATQCEEQGCIRIHTASQPLLRVVIRKSVLKKHRDKIDKVVEAYQKAKERMISTPSPHPSDQSADSTSRSIKPA